MKINPSFYRRRVAFLTMAALLFNGVLFAQKEEQAPLPPPPPVTVDGNAADWPQQNLLYNKDTKLAYAVSNDKDGINILLKSDDQQQQMKMLNAGVQILVDVEGKKSKKTGINFPLAGKMESPQFQRTAQTIGGANGQQKPDRKKMQQELLLQKRELELFGFGEEANGLADLRYAPVKVAINWDEANAMVYEMHIPYSVFKAAPKPDDKISIGIVIKGMKQPEMGREGDHSDMPAGGPGGPPPGGFGGPDGQRPDRNDFQKMFEETSFWIKYTITP